jgi:dTDP-glucose 4,6-dehydratase
MGTLLVTGGAGFIGSNFVRSVLARTGGRVVVLDKLTYAGSLKSLEDVASDPRFVFVLGDIADEGCVERVLRDHGPDAIVNFAAETHVDRSIDEPGGFVQTNIVGTYVLLEAARRYVADGRAPGAFRLLHVSTDEVYGSLGPTGLFSETTPYAPNSPYAASKASADHLVRAYHRTFGLPVLITNCSNNYGPYQFPEKLVPLMTLNALEGKPLPIYGDGGNVRDWLYVEDHCAGILSALERGRVGEGYNLGGGNERTNLEMIDAICGVLERIVPAGSNPHLVDRGIAGYAELKTFVTDRKGHDRRYAIDAAKARRELGWEPAHGFASGLERTLRWYVEHRDWCEAVQEEGRYRRERLGLTAKPAGPRADGATS